jgi:uncharacterized integral membrane protein (TIGR02327 family)
MQTKFILYVIVTPFVILALDSININQIFKKNKVFQARLFFFFIALALIYLVTNFIYECAELSKIF